MKNYLKEFMPQLYNMGLQLIEKEITKRMNINDENKKLVLEAAKIRKSNNRN